MLLADTKGTYLPNKEDKKNCKRILEVLKIKTTEELEEILETIIQYKMRKIDTGKCQCVIAYAGREDNIKLYHEGLQNTIKSNKKKGVSNDAKQIIKIANELYNKLSMELKFKCKDIGYIIGTRSRDGEIQFGFKGSYERGQTSTGDSFIVVGAEPEVMAKYLKKLKIEAKKFEEWYDEIACKINKIIRDDSEIKKEFKVSGVKWTIHWAAASPEDCYYFIPPNYTPELEHPDDDPISDDT